MSLARPDYFDIGSGLAVCQGTILVFFEKQGSFFERVPSVETSLRLPGEPFDKLRVCDVPRTPGVGSVPPVGDGTEAGSFFANSEDIS